jgi:hypothetical protein
LIFWTSEILPLLGWALMAIGVSGLFSFSPRSSVLDALVPWRSCSKP